MKKKKKTLFKKCLLIQIVLYKVCKNSGMMPSVFNVSPKSGHVMLFFPFSPKCVFQLVIYFPFFLYL